METELRGEGLARLDPQRIQQAALTLVDNAAKYGQPGGEVTLSSSVRAGELRIAVEDRGPGIPGDELPRIFERFYRLDRNCAKRGREVLVRYPSTYEKALLYRPLRRRVVLHRTPYSYP